MTFEPLPFVESGRLLAFSGELRSRMTAVTDFSRALDYAGEPDWLEVRRRYAPARLDRRQQEPLYRHCLAFLPVKFHPALNPIVQDLAEMAQGGPLQELLAAAYQAGGWPCGWEGAFPQGQLLVFWDPAGATPDLPGSEMIASLMAQQFKLRGAL